MNDVYELIYGNNPSPDVWSKVIHQYGGYVLRYIKVQTPEICLAAVKQNSWALQYVKDISMLPR